MTSNGLQTVMWTKKNCKCFTQMEDPWIEFCFTAKKEVKSVNMQQIAKEQWPISVSVLNLYVYAANNAFWPRSMASEPLLFEKESFQEMLKETRHQIQKCF